MAGNQVFLVLPHRPPVPLAAAISSPHPGNLMSPGWGVSSWMAEMWLAGASQGVQRPVLRATVPIIRGQQVAINENSQVAHGSEPWGTGKGPGES